MSKITIDHSVVEQALEMLNRINAADDDRDFLTEDEAVYTIMAIDELDAAIRAALDQPQVEQEPTPNGATHKQPKQGAFYKRVDGKWYVWSRMESDKPHRWYISPGTTESCLEPLYTHPQPKRQPLTDVQVHAIWDSKYRGWFSRDQMEHITRAIEAAHGIKEQK